MALPPPRGAIVFRNVSFRYTPGGQDVLKGISLAIRPGEVIGIVGPSGSGKSSLTKLVQRFYSPQEGQVLLDGLDLAHADPSWLRRHIGVVLQENLLFNRTLHENIAFADPSMSRAKVMQVARLAGADEFIARLPAGYDTSIEERGANLSGGQRQRILIFDEATSALDYESESVIQANMRHIVNGRTVLLIAHRLSTVRNADRIVGMLDGRIVEGPCSWQEPRRHERFRPAAVRRRSRRRAAACARAPAEGDHGAGRPGVPARRTGDPGAAALARGPRLSIRRLRLRVRSPDIVAVAHGKVQPTGKVKVVQPLETGKVRTILAQNGAVVREGDPLVELDPDEALAEARAAEAAFLSWTAEALRRADAVAAARSEPVADRPTAWPAAIPPAVRAREDAVRAADVAKLAGDLAALDAQAAQKRAEWQRLRATVAAQDDLIATQQERVGMRASLLKTGSGTKASLIDATESLNYQRTVLAGQKGQLAEVERALETIAAEREKTLRAFVAENSATKARRSAASGRRGRG